MRGYPMNKLKMILMILIIMIKIKMVEVEAMDSVKTRAAVSLWKMDQVFQKLRIIYTIIDQI